MDLQGEISRVKHESERSEALNRPMLFDAA